MAGKISREVTRIVDESRAAPGDGTLLIRSDPWLAPYRDRLRERQELFNARLSAIEAGGGILGPISEGHRYFGLNRGRKAGTQGVWYREWAPGARQLFLAGDFNEWNRASHPMRRDPFGIWSIFLPDERDGKAHPHRMSHGSRLKVHVIPETTAGSDSSIGGSEPMDRIPAYIRRTIQNPENSGDFVGQFWEPETPYSFRHAAPPAQGAPRIYEAHVGMASEEPRIGTFSEFTRDVLPRIRELGYNTVQLMAIQEHPYYASFGYHVSGFFAVSSRFGTPEDLKALVDAAHGLGLRVFLDLVHSHAVRNTREGLNLLDGTGFQYFHAGPRGYHPAWDSMLFDYAKYEVLRYLLSNVRFWREEYHFDGFRFDGVTSMLYLDHGLGRVFSGYDDYFGSNIDESAITYLKLANTLAHSLDPQVVTIAEDVSGMPGIARPVSEGGLGFDYRLAMGVPDYWIRILKERRDEDWNLAELYQVLLNRRRDEKHIGYAESHDQALVGDKTLAFRLMDQEMYWNMSRLRQSPVIDRGLALHKLIRLITFSLAGEGWLAFMGNEFGHPEWIDFPREGNAFSFQHARRQWSLSEREDLHYRDLLRFDQALQALDGRFGVLSDPLIEQLALHEELKQLVYRRGPLVFAFNFHPSESFPGLRIPVPDARDYRVILNSDDIRFGGFGRVAESMRYPWQDVGMHGRRQSLELYLPARSAQVLSPE